MGIIKRALVALYSFLQFVFAMLGAIFKPFQGLFALVAQINTACVTALSVCPPWLLGLATFSLVVGIILLILGRK